MYSINISQRYEPVASFGKTVGSTAVDLKSDAKPQKVKPPAKRAPQSATAEAKASKGSEAF